MSLLHVWHWIWSNVCNTILLLLLDNFLQLLACILLDQSYKFCLDKVLWYSLGSHASTVCSLLIPISHVVLVLYSWSTLTYHITSSPQYHSPNSSFQSHHLFTWWILYSVFYYQYSLYVSSHNLHSIMLINFA